MVSESIDEIETSELLDELQFALNHLYDPIELRNSAFVRRFADDGLAIPSGELRNLLIEAIEALRPDETVPSHANLARYYPLLYQRYIEQYPQHEVAADLGLSVRQLRRVEKSALSLLAEQVGERIGFIAAFESDGRRLADVDQPNGRDVTTPSRQEELAWSQKAFASETVDAAELVESVLGTMLPLVERLGLTISTDIQDELPLLEVPVISVRQALLSILTAMAHRVPRGHIVVLVRKHDGHVTVRVNAEDQWGAALEWNQNDSENMKMAQELLTLSGTRLRVIAGDAVPDAWHVSFTFPSVVPFDVLVLDDNPDTLRLLERYTANTRYRLTGIRDPSRLIPLAEELLPDIIVLDIMLPGIDGWEMLGRLTAHPVLSDTPIIVATILPQKSLAAAMGAAAFVRKPISRDAFLSTLDMQVDALRG